MREEDQLKQELLQELGLEGLPEEKRAELLTAMTESLLKRITVRILEELSEEDREDFDTIRESNDPEQIREFLTNRIEGYDEMVDGVVSDFKEEMKANMRELEEEPSEE